VHARTDDPASYIERAHLVVNLSRVDLWIETFGLTILEAMVFGIPVIAPPVGGPTEILTHGHEGWLIDSRNSDALVDAVVLAAEDRELYLRMSSCARIRAREFDFASFALKLRAIVANERWGELSE
jgi:glycosyltransferase involved in cell wall biosynthesis